MSILRLFSSRAPAPTPAPGATAPIARERLQILLAHERGSVRGKPDLLMQLREEILAVVQRHVTLDQDKVMVRMERGKNVSTLEVDIELPSGSEQAFAATG
jgi:cell division topological specificity factor